MITFQALNLSEDVDMRVAAVPASATERGTQAFQVPYRHGARRSYRSISTALLQHGALAYECRS